MKLATTTTSFDGYVQTVEEKIQCFRETGFRLLDCSFYNEAKPDSHLMQSDWQTYVAGIKRSAEENGMQFVQAHAPGGNPFGEESARLTEATKRAILACGVLGIPNIVVHPGWCGAVSKEEFFEKNRAFYRSLTGVAEQAQVHILVENNARANMHDNYYFYDGATLYEFIKWVNHPFLHICWDVGHANLEGAQYDEILKLKDELRAVHIQDNFGMKDDHIQPFSGTLNMDEVMQALIDVEYKGYFTFEATNGMRRMGAWPVFRRESAHGNGKLASPSVALQIKSIALLYEIGKHILSAYDCYEY